MVARRSVPRRALDEVFTCATRIPSQMSDFSARTRGKRTQGNLLFVRLPKHPTVPGTVSDSGLTFAPAAVIRRETEERNMQQLENKIALITGAKGGLGTFVTKAFLAAGAQVAGV